MPVIAFSASVIGAGIVLTVMTTASPVGAFEIQFVVSIFPSGESVF